MTVTRIFTEEPEKRPDGSTAMCKKYLAEVENYEDEKVTAGIVSDLIKRYSRIYRIVKSE
jgi:hypothetical protein